MRRRPVKAGWRLLATIAALSFPLVFVLVWIEESRFTRHLWQVSPLSVAKWSLVVVAAILLILFIDQRCRR